MSEIKHQNFIDLMKAVGMFLIIFGHVVGDPEHIYNQIAQPVHTKQIGVAFFVFVTGWGLANNTRSPIKAVFNRIFPFYFYGIIFAIFISVLFLFIKDDTNPSNYLPFFFGANVFLNYFPANPTTWYIGTYLHILLFWYIFLRGKEIGIKHLLLAFIAENIIRCTFMYWQQDHIAYMLLPNWLTTFMLGMYLHRSRQKPTTAAVFLYISALICFLILWTILTRNMGFDGAFPFRNMTSAFDYSLPVESILISCTYITYTLLFFELARRLPGNALISVMGRATLITVIIHMPVVFETHKYFYSFFNDLMIARYVFILTLYFGLAIVAEIIYKSLNINTIREKSWSLIEKHLGKILLR